MKDKNFHFRGRAGNEGIELSDRDFKKLGDLKKILLARSFRSLEPSEIFEKKNPLRLAPSIRFQLTYKAVMSKRHSEAFPNQVSSSNPRGKNGGIEYLEQTLISSNCGR